LTRLPARITSASCSPSEHDTSHTPALYRFVIRQSTLAIWVKYLYQGHCLLVMIFEEVREVFPYFLNLRVNDIAPTMHEVIACAKHILQVFIPLIHLTTYKIPIQHRFSCWKSSY
jgi:hypothetical protein